MKKTFAMVAAATLMGSAAFAPYAFAQATTPAQPSTEAPATPGVAPMTPQAATPGVADPSVASAAFLTEQSADQVSANEYIGKSIYTATDENIGAVRDVLIEKDRGIVAAIVGVGGFLGMGEKNVALPVERISTVTLPDNGEIRLTTTETADSLKAAPQFMSTEEKAAAAAKPMAPDGTTTSSTRP